MDLYELLGVVKSASEEELKRAYKKQALKLHPDRNFDRVEEATSQFAKVQAAYDVLSDPQERAWYDAHGLAGGFGSGFGAYDNDIGAGKVTTSEDLKRYFDPMLYQNTTDGPDGIYQIASNIFTRLAQEEAEAVFDQGLDDEYARLPTFGDSMSNWVRETKPFYDAWLGFSSKKTFAWYDQYRLRDAPDRRTRRAMENQNQKARDAARKEFNETVRTLTSFIRKRDPRFKLRAKHTGHTKMSAKAMANEAARAQAARDRKANWENREEYEEQEWEKIEEEDFDEFFSDGEKKKKKNTNENDSEGESGSDDSAESDEDVVEVFECVVCDKTFRTRKHFTSHELSKKHTKALQKLKREMRKEGIELGLDGIDGENESNVEDEEQQTSAEEDEEVIKPQKQTAKPSFNVLMQDASESEEESEPEPEQAPAPAPAPVKSTKQGKKAPAKPEESIEDLLAQLDGARMEDSKDDDWSTGNNKKKGKKGKAGKAKKNNTGPMSKGWTDEDLGKVPKDLLGGVGGAGEEADNDTTVPAKKVGKAKQRRMKRADQDDVALICVVCQTQFESRNKLFDHVKVSGHAAPVNSTRRK